MRGDAEIVALCRNHLEALPGIRKVTIHAPAAFSDLPAADLAFVLETDVGPFTYRGAVKRRLTPTKLDHWLLLTLPRGRRQKDERKPILFADYVSPGNAQRLREADVDYVDAAGNLLIHRPGKLHLLKSGARPRTLADSRPARLFMPSGLQVLFVLLVEPAAAALPYRELAAQSGVALGSIAVIMNELVAPMASVAACVLLKFVAYNDRPAERVRDLVDIVHCLELYADEPDARRYEIGEPEVDGGPVLYDEAGAYLLGQETAALARQESLAAVRAVLASIGDEDARPIHQVLAEEGRRFGEGARGRALYRLFRVFSAGLGRVA